MCSRTKSIHHICSSCVRMTPCLSQSEGLGGPHVRALNASSSNSKSQPGPCAKTQLEGMTDCDPRLGRERVCVCRRNRRYESLGRLEIYQTSTRGAHQVQQAAFTQRRHQTTFGAGAWEFFDGLIGLFRGVGFAGKKRHCIDIPPQYVCFCAISSLPLRHTCCHHRGAFPATRSCGEMGR